MAEHGAQYRVYGWFGVFNAIFYYVLWTFLLPEAYENFLLRIGCLLLCSALILHKYWPTTLQPYLPLYWHITLLLTLPAFFVFMLLMNHFSIMWSMNLIVIVFFTMLLVDLSSAVVLLTGGALIGMISGGLSLIHLSPTVPIFPKNFHDSQHFSYLGFLMTCAISIVIAAIFSRNRERMEQCKQATIRTEAESAEKSEFIANMSHDLRTSLTGIKSIAEHEQSNISPRNPMYQSWQTVHQSSQQLYDFIESMVLTAKFGLTKTLEPEPFCIETTIKNVATLLKPAFQQKHLGVHIEPQNFEPLPLLRGHPVLIQHLLLNLLNNAIKFTEAHGEVTITFELNRKHDDDTPPQLILSVMDTGIGIAEENKIIIFQAFRRVMPAFKQAAYQGSGLGLYMVKKMLALLNGEIFVSSEVGQGSTFTCCIPVDIEHDLEAIRKQAQESNLVSAPIQTAATRTTCASKQILLVEDNNVARRAIKLRLQLLVADYGMDEAETVNEALNLSKTKEYALILMDIGLPDGSGYEAAKKIRTVETSKNKTTPIVAVTAHIDEKEKQACLIGKLMQEVKYKPLTQDDIAMLLERYLPHDSDEQAIQ